MRDDLIAAGRAGPFYHMLPASRYHDSYARKEHESARFRREGLTSCTVGEAAMIAVANLAHGDEPGAWVVLVIDPTKVAHPVQWHDGPCGSQPALRGPLNLDAVSAVRDVVRGADGRFVALGPERPAFAPGEAPADSAGRAPR